MGDTGDTDHGPDTQAFEALLLRLKGKQVGIDATGILKGAGG